MDANDKMTQETENEVIAKANQIKSVAFSEAEKKWAETPDEEKKRPWPRCHNLECNRTLTCQTTASDPLKLCEGFDF